VIPVNETRTANPNEMELEIQRHGGYFRLEFQVHRGRGISIGDRQECEGTNKLKTLLTSMESKIQDKHQSITHAFMEGVFPKYRCLLERGICFKFYTITGTFNG